MNGLPDYFRYLGSALQLWRARRMQAALSSLGIVVGVSGLVLVIALGEGAGRELQSALGTLGTGSVIVKQPIGETATLTNDKVEAARRLLSTHLQNSSLQQVQQQIVTSEEFQLAAARIVGTDRQYQSIYKLQLQHGRFLTDLDLKEQHRICVLGSEAAKILFPRGQVVGRQLRIGSHWYQVVGWLQPGAFRLPKLEALGTSGIDSGIFVPVTTLAGTGAAVALDEVVFQFRDEDHMTAALEPLKHILDGDRQVAALEYIVPIELLRQKQKLQQVFQYLLLGIAALMLIVGGVGIMNMMMVNVISRRAEIGLRRAIGATRKDIILQFVTESSVIALVGGLAGVVLGYLVAQIIDMATDLPMAFSSTAAAIGFCSSVAIGIVFGSYPSLQAASVSPVQALNEL